MRRLLLFVGVMILMRCELIVDVDVPYDGDRVVVNAVPDTSSPWAVNLSQSNYILAKNDDLNNEVIPAADVTIFNLDSSEEIKLTQDNTGNFTAPQHPQAGQRYKIVVDAKDLDDVEAEMTMPEIIPIIDVKWDSANMKQNGFYTNIDLEITFDDPAGIQNYYQVLVYGYLKDSVETHREAVPLHITDLAIGTEDDFVSIFSDATFDGKRYVAPFSCRFQFYRPIRPRPGDPQLVRVELLLISLSKEYFLYEESQKLQGQVAGDPFAQPVPVYSNVSNGFGIFGGTATDMRAWNRTPTAQEQP